MGVPTATVIMKGPDGISRHASSIGTGPVDATYKARAAAPLSIQNRLVTSCFPFKQEPPAFTRALPPAPAGTYKASHRPSFALICLLAFTVRLTAQEHMT